MPLLAIDQGNSWTKCGLVDGETLTATWGLETDKAADPAELAEQMDLPAVTRVALCSVVPELLPAWTEAARRAGKPLTIITGATPTALRNAYATPDTLGPDRLMAAVAAARVGMPVIPVLLGTATVVDAVADGAYLGGMIAPGVGILAERLAARASALSAPAWQTPAHAIGQSTDEALAHGLFFQAVGGLRAMIAATRAEIRGQTTNFAGTVGEKRASESAEISSLSPNFVPLVLTGGWAARLAPHLDGVALLDEFLILRGIAYTISEA